MKVLIRFFITLCLLPSCRKPESLPEEFRASRQVLFSQRRPLDSLLIIGPEQLARWDSFRLAYAQRLAETSLSEEGRQGVQGGLREAESKTRQYRRDPSAYNLGGALKQVLAARQIPLGRRLRAIEAQMEQAPQYYQAAKANLRAPIPERCRLAVEKQRLALGFLKNELQDSLSRSQLSAAEARRFLMAAEKARIAVKDYLAFCQSLYFEHQDSLIHRND